MILFHGSNVPIDSIDLSKSKPNKDFGRAFYLSPDLNQATEMASFKAEILGGSEIVSQFEIDSFDGLRLKVFNSYSEDWAHFVKQGYITFDEFLNRIKYIKGITFQYAFCTQKAIEKLKRL